MIFGKKKQNDIDQQKELLKKQMENTEKMNNEVVVHAMPEKFLLGMGRANQAKKMGIVIFSFGALFLVIISVALYLFVFKKPKTIISEETLTTENTVSTQTETSETSEEIIASIPLEQIKATSTPDQINNLIATSTDETATSTEDMIATTTPEEVGQDTDEALADLDKDGLTKSEEELFGTDIAKIDSDGDSYSDGEEIKNLYNPAGEGKVTSNKNIKEYINATFKYSNFIPLAWIESEVGGDDSVIFKSTDNHIFQINAQPNSGLKNISDWYKLQFGLVPEEANMINGTNWQGAMSEDGLNYYITDNSYTYIYTISYNPEFDAKPVYINLFNMIIKSFKIES